MVWNVLVCSFLLKKKGEIPEWQRLVIEAESGEDGARRRAKDLVRRICPRAPGRGAGRERGRTAGERRGGRIEIKDAA
jgi:hypothetical protein